MTASPRRELRSAATSTSTTAIDLIRPLTDARPIKPTSARCLSARRPNRGRGSTYRRGNSVQTAAATSFVSNRPWAARMPDGSTKDLKAVLLQQWGNNPWYIASNGDMPYKPLAAAMEYVLAQHGW